MNATIDTIITRKTTLYKYSHIEKFKRSLAMYKRTNTNKK